MHLASCIIGIGSPHGDDQVGWLIAEELQHQKIDGLIVHKAQLPLDILDHVEGVEWLGICDACQGLGCDGKWQQWTWPDPNIAQQKFAGSHDISLTGTLELAARLKRLPTTVTIWGVEISRCAPESEVSPSVLAAISQITDAMVREIKRFQGHHA
jgi:hydrogenase maturation protease